MLLAPCLKSNVDFVYSKNVPQFLILVAKRPHLFISKTRDNAVLFPRVIDDAFAKYTFLENRTDFPV
jgi:hypothetical protein